MKQRRSPGFVLLDALRAIVRSAFVAPNSLDRYDAAERPLRPELVERDPRRAVLRPARPAPATVAVEPEFEILELDVDLDLDAPRRRRPRVRVDAASLAASVVTAEILGAPVAFRNDLRWDRG